MEDPVTLVVMLLVLALTFLVFSKSQVEPTAPTATGNGLLGRQAVAPPASARAGHCKIVDTTKLSAVGKAMHANLPQRQGVRSICISGNALVKFDGATMTLAPEVVASLVDVISTGDVFIIFLVTDEAAKAKTGLPPHRILCCTTVIGKIALIRQIEPLLLVEELREVATKLRPFVTKVVYLLGATGDVLPPLPNKDNVEYYADWSAFTSTFTA
ncbi:hypothetical protein SPRG_20389 [Saprolegnia parasitica CBS 223.65]|uniref:Uncharacterized protein n=1 Tax=Saprolegnia parasitica (strain CBS 223.65) TaxID=695850 RepID=A0A067CMK1_SAPPC|nr:hypothetical protein SPRG_20389 [Saprolegnia parasitica CBS 223.65]KDO27751.1 hypothetical protein SPRG_20389 [Saprolegnia parasitica CBS 223.65]|eukprot:XP_012201619.1 hypothetical protein SPRG_20389 [Saprolegnia parasitica CBS 223.65]